MKYGLWMVLGLLLVLAACNNNQNKTNESLPDVELRKQRDDQIIREYLAANNITAQKTTTGLYYEIKTPGLGNLPVPGDSLFFHYEGRVMYGKLFESTRFKGETFRHVVDIDNAIDGFEEAAKLLRKGGRGVFYIPSQLAYKDRAYESIPANSILIFDMELADLRKPKK